MTDQDKEKMHGLQNPLTIQGNKMPRIPQLAKSRVHLCIFFDLIMNPVTI